ncbi:uncharacterized protein G2W53_002810 [Senna tora]|uniref:Uncharacterized protein n=1 Tax=Senna tora TaxID=362788 RepID=A0A835CIN3_9FABA|nr:uncharacterized protein G2W53_002810 [Senna tora]
MGVVEVVEKAERKLGVSEYYTIVKVKTLEGEEAQKVYAIPKQEEKWVESGHVRVLMESKASAIS